MIKIIFKYGPTYDLYVGYDTTTLTVLLMTPEYDAHYHMESLAEYIKTSRRLRWAVVDSIYFLQGECNGHL